MKRNQINKITYSEIYNTIWAYFRLKISKIFTISYNFLLTLKTVHMLKSNLFSYRAKICHFKYSIDLKF